MRYIFICSGWNCEDYVYECMDSIANQEWYDWLAMIVDDGSKDMTYAAMEVAQEGDARFILHRCERNMGASYSRFVAMHSTLSGILRPDDVFILLGLDDALAHTKVLQRIDEEYQKGADMTYGSYEYMNGDPAPVLEEMSIEKRMARAHRTGTWNFYPPQTFRAELGLSVPKRYFLDETGRWMRNCTELALIFPILDIVDPDRIHFIPDPILSYRHDHPWTTIARLGRRHKKRMHKILSAMPPHIQI